MSPGLHEGQETATYTQLATQKVEIKSPPAQKTGVSDCANGVNPVLITLVKTPKSCFLPCCLYEWKQCLCAGQRGEVLWWNRKSDSFCKGISHMIGTVPSLALITTPGRLIICFCLCCLVSQSLCASERVTLFSKRVSLYLQRSSTHLPLTCRPRSTSAACSTDNGCVWPC